MTNKDTAVTSLIDFVSNAYCDACHTNVVTVPGSGACYCRCECGTIIEFSSSPFGSIGVNVGLLINSQFKLKETKNDL